MILLFMFLWAIFGVYLFISMWTEYNDFTKLELILIVPAILLGPLSPILTLASDNYNNDVLIKSRKKKK